MSLLPLLLLLASTAFPSSKNHSSWMSPDSFHLTIGMSRRAAEAKLTEHRWKLKEGKDGDLVVEIENNKTMTIGFQNGKIDSIRFEYVAFLQDVKAAFADRETALRKSLGPPRRAGSSAKVLIYDKTAPNIHVVLSTDRSTSYGKQGLGFLVVRYFAPPAA